MSRPSPKPDLVRLRELLDYDPATGIFHWKPRAHVQAKVAGCQTSKGYVQIMVDGVRYGANRLAWYYVTGEWPEHETDHKNGKRWDNRFTNLRPATRSENGRNRARAMNNTSGRTGVCWNKRLAKWQASITVDGKLLHLGLFVHRHDAIAARKQAEAVHFKNFARH